MPRVPLILAAASLLIAAAQAPDPGPPAWVEVDPNAIEEAGQPMQIDVGGIPQGQTVTLQILQDCNGDHRPDLQGQGDCKSPLYARDSSKAGSRNRVEDSLDFAALEKSGTPLPRNRALWLRASGRARSRGSSPSSDWSTIHAPSGRPRGRSSGSARAARAAWPRRCAATAARSASRKRPSR